MGGKVYSKKQLREAYISAGATVPPELRDQPRGRPAIYATDEERKAAKRQQWREWNERNKKKSTVKKPVSVKKTAKQKTILSPNKK